MNFEVYRGFRDKEFSVYRSQQEAQERRDYELALRLAAVSISILMSINV